MKCPIVRIVGRSRENVADNQEIRQESGLSEVLVVINHPVGDLHRHGTELVKIREYPPYNFKWSRSRYHK